MIAAILGGNVTVGGSGYSEFAEYITTGKMKVIAVTSETRLNGIDVPMMKEQGYNVVIGNWRGLYGAGGITPAQRKELTDLIVKATKTKSWAEALEKNNWTPALLTGTDFDKFVDDEFASDRRGQVDDLPRAAGLAFAAGGGRCRFGVAAAAEAAQGTDTALSLY